MALPKCEKCNTKFKWSIIAKNIWGVYITISCHKCGSYHGIVYSSRIVASSLLLIPFMVFAIFVSVLGLYHTIIISIISGVLLALFAPFLVKYKAGDRS